VPLDVATTALLSSILSKSLALFSNSLTAQA